MGSVLSGLLGVGSTLIVRFGSGVGQGSVYGLESVLGLEVKLCMCMGVVRVRVRH